MTTKEKKEIYKNLFPQIISNRLIKQFNEQYFDSCQEKNKNLCNDLIISSFILCFNNLQKTDEGVYFWADIANLYIENKVVDHKQILEIFYDNNINP